MPTRRPATRLGHRLALVFFAGVAALSCSSSDGGLTAPSITTGSLTVTAATTGPDAPASYTVALDDGTPRSIEANGSTSYSSVAGGSHTLLLGAVPDNCTVGGSNPRSATVVAGEAASVAFSVTCVALTGSLEVTATTSGADPDPDGYAVEIDGAGGVPIDTDETLAPQVLPVGEHEVELTGIAANCAVTGANPRSVTVATDETVSTVFEVTCDATTGAIEVTATTTGDDIDADGYVVDLDGASSTSIDANGTATFSGVSEGSHSLTLSGIAANCTVTSDNPAASTVVIGETDEVTFELTCAQVNAAPTVTIGAPDTTSTVAPLSVAPGDPVSFSGSAQDPEDGPLTGTDLVWVSNVDGQIGTGESFSTSALSEGQHAVTLTATDSELATGTETVLVIVVPPSAPGYQITFRLAEGTSLTSGQRTAIEEAITKMEGIVIGDLPDLPISFGEGDCGPGMPVLEETVDDLLIYLSVVPIDGPGGTLGAAGPCWVRDPGFLPAVGFMFFDSADMEQLETLGLVDEVLLHEAMHIMGFGTIWSALSLLEDPTTGPGGAEGNDTYFSGPEAIAWFDSIGGGSYTGGNVVPVENDHENFGPGSLDSHWRESVFDHELMTPAIGGGLNPLSVVTVGQFEDLGYAVDYAAADPYVQVFTLHAEGGGSTLHLGDDVWRGPLWVAKPDGSARRVR